MKQWEKSTFLEIHGLDQKITANLCFGNMVRIKSGRISKQKQRYGPFGADMI
jgi:hypothetical protein